MRLKSTDLAPDGSLLVPEDGDRDPGPGEMRDGPIAIRPLALGALG